MKLNIFSDEWRGTRSENTFLRILVPLLIVSNIASGTALIVRDRETVLVPPQISEVMKVSSRKADVGYKKSWGLYVATLIGNVTPGNADFVNEQLSQIVDAMTYHRMKQDLATQIIEIRNNNLTVDFEPNQIMYEEETDRVFILGKSQTSGTAGRLSKEARVFEIKIDMANGRPLVMDIQSYQGEARTAPVMEKLERRRLAQEERDKRRAQTK